jgi:hypothetical protein
MQLMPQNGEWDRRDIFWFYLFSFAVLIKLSVKFFESRTINDILTRELRRGSCSYWRPVCRRNEKFYRLT